MYEKKWNSEQHSDKWSLSPLRKQYAHSSWSPNDGHSLTHTVRICLIASPH